ncbi:MAG: oligosaccharide flippase family protein [Deltaproteobacteria bacterium]|nr:oligosaccharide flippase family protein [Deltaproteobacteria bacterium]
MTSGETEQQSTRAEQTAAAAGRGVAFIAAAKAYFMVAGYVIYFRLPRLLKTAARWGNYLLVVRLTSFIDNCIVTGTIQGVSHFTAHGSHDANAVKAAALRVQLFLGGLVAVAYFLFAPLIAQAERDPSLTPFYRLAAGIVCCYAFYAVFVGSLNGLRQFGRQATLDVVFATLRAAMILGAAAAGLGVFGAIGGFVAAAFVILCVSAIWVGLPGRSKTPFPAGQIWGYMPVLLVYNFFLNAMMNTDLFLLKRLVADLIAGSDQAAHALTAAEESSRWAGYYGTAQTLAFIPYQAILAVTFVIFPLISRSTFEKDSAATRRYVHQTLRLSLIFVASVATVLIANPAAVIGVPYQVDYRIGAQSLEILSAGMICFSIFTIINTMLNGAGRKWQAVALSFATFCVGAVANWWAISSATSAEAALARAAWATTASYGFGALLAGVALFRSFSALFPLLTLLRVVVACVVATLVGRFIPEVSRVVTLAECVGVMLVYYLVLVAIGELRRSDIDKILGVFLRRKKKGS